MYLVRLLFFFFNDTATTEIYTLSLHDALPIYAGRESSSKLRCNFPGCFMTRVSVSERKWTASSISLNKACTDRKSTRLNSSHSSISYAVFCLKKKKKKNTHTKNNTNI